MMLREIFINKDIMHNRSGCGNERMIKKVTSWDYFKCMQFTGKRLETHHTPHPIGIG
jgi:hypothetical protein